jgi:type III restriction enzyme
LSDSGSVFVQISDNNLHHIRELMDDVFGADQVVGIVTFKKTSGAGSPSGGTEVLASVSDYLIWYAKDRSKVKYRQLYKDKEVGGDVRPTLVINWERVSTLTLDPASTPISADVAPALGGAADMSKVVAIDLEKLPDGFRLQRSIFVAARKAFATLEGQFKGAPDYLVLQLIRIVEQFLTSDRMVIPSLFHSDPLRKRILIALNIDLIVQHLLEFTKEQNTESLEPVYDEDRPVGRTGDMRTWFTAKPARPAEKSHISHVVGDAAWEQYAANIFEKSSDVTSFAKNDHLGFEVFYLWGGSRRRYIPDFLVRMANGKTLVLEIKGQDSPQNRAKREALGEWIAAVNSVGGFGTWCWDLAFSPAAVHDIIAKHGV